VVTTAKSVVVAVAVLEETVRADTVVVMLVRARKVVRRASLLLLSVVDSVVVAVLLPAPKQLDRDLAWNGIEDARTPCGAGQHPRVGLIFDYETTKNGGKMIEIRVDAGVV
jgi:hypothetical protein